MWSSLQSLNWGSIVPYAVGAGVIALSVYRKLAGPIPEDKGGKSKADASPSWSTGVPMSIAMGLAFGVALEKGRVFEPQVIVDQMKFSRFIMLKMFLSALTSGALFLGTLSIIPATRHLFNRSRTCYEGCIQRGWPATAFGAFLLGVGMTISGACPGMVLAQLGTGVSSGPFVFAGGLAAALVYAYVEPYMRGFIKWKYQGGRVSMDRYFDVHFSTVAFGLAAAVIAFLTFLESLVPWTSELRAPAIPIAATDNVFELVAWSPYVAGAIIGFNQLPAVIFLQDTLGSASSYATIVSHIVTLVVGRQEADKNDVIRKSRDGLGNMWQVYYVLAVIAGSAGSAILSYSWGQVSAIDSTRAFAGGFLLLFGSRMAGGCTSGHGISGAALLYWLSWVAVPAMFGGGIATALAFY